KRRCGAFFIGRVLPTAPSEYNASTFCRNRPMSHLVHQDTIAAIATAPGRGGVGIIRVSAERAPTIAQVVLGITPTPRYAHYGPSRAVDGTVLDEGIALFFPKPHSFTGEDVLELQGHGGPVVLDLLLKEVVALGCRLARPGEFSERAFLNDKPRSEEHTSELQSRENLVCRLLLEKKNTAD